MVEFTKHAEEMLRERGSTRETIVDAILHPDWTKKRSGEERHALKRIGDKVLRVVLQRKKPPYRVITVFYDRRVKP
ncbi:MAG: DUF4258 domain-containing protein [Candidatus Fervidibacter sp.]|uniref:DUF4258 domain-containing protein n=1 Tax=Candidatus Fervidibacter sp. TaxID=3100871 RepID=UPI004049C5CC